MEHGPTEHDRVVTSGSIIDPTIDPHGILFKTILFCMPPYKAVDTAICYGRMYLTWCITHMVHTLSPASWIAAVNQKSLGMLMYLSEYTIPQPDFDLLQSCIDRLFIDGIVFALRIQSTHHTLLYIDEAALTANVRLVRHLLDGKRRCRIRHARTIQYLVDNNELPMLQCVETLLPNPRPVSLTVPIQKNWKALITHVLSRQDPRGVLGDFARWNRHELVLQYAANLTEHDKQIVFDRAVSYGNHETYTLPLFAGLIPSDAAICACCTHGHLATLQYLNPVVPQNAMIEAIRGKHLALIRYLHTVIIGFQYNGTVLNQAICTGNSKVACLVYTLGLYCTLSPTSQLLVFRHRMYDAALFFSRLGIDMWRRELFLEACTWGDTRLIQECLRHRNYDTVDMDTARRKIIVAPSNEQDRETSLMSLMAAQEPLQPMTQDPV